MHQQDYCTARQRICAGDRKASAPQQCAQDAKQRQRAGCLLVPSSGGPQGPSMYAVDASASSSSSCCEWLGDSPFSALHATTHIASAVQEPALAFNFVDVTMWHQV